MKSSLPKMRKLLKEYQQICDSLMILPTEKTMQQIINWDKTTSKIRTELYKIAEKKPLLEQEILACIINTHKN